VLLDFTTVGLLDFRLSLRDEPNSLSLQSGRCRVAAGRAAGPLERLHQAQALRRPSEKPSPGSQETIPSSTSLLTYVHSCASDNVANRVVSYETGSDARWSALLPVILSISPDLHMAPSLVVGSSDVRQLLRPQDVGVTWIEGKRVVPALLPYLRSPHPDALHRASLVWPRAGASRSYQWPAMHRQRRIHTS
jgi:hypothetical protein